MNSGLGGWQTQTANNAPINQMPMAASDEAARKTLNSTENISEAEQAQIKKIKTSQAEVEGKITETESYKKTVILDGNVEVRNARLGSINEKQAAKAIIDEHRLSVNDLKKGNYGYIEGVFGKLEIDRNLVRSGTFDINTPRVFEALEVNTNQVVNGEGAWLRVTDSEYIMLNDLANRFGAKKGEVHMEAEGELKIVSERHYCPSCKYVIQQFQEMFPNVKLILIDDLRVQ